MYSKYSHLQQKVSSIYSGLGVDGIKTELFQLTPCPKYARSIIFKQLTLTPDILANFVLKVMAGASLIIIILKLVQVSLSVGLVTGEG